MATLTIEEAFQLALTHHRAGRLAEAEAIYRQILAVQPRHPDALHLVGLIAHHAGRSDVAADWIRQAIALAPGVPDYHSNLGEAYRALGGFDEAIASYRQAIALKPDFAEARSNLGAALKNKGQLDEAIAAYRQAIALKPDYPEAHSNLGAALREMGRLDETIAAFRQAIALKPNFPEAHYNLGHAFKDKGHLDEAITSLRQAIALRPNFSEAHFTLALILLLRGNFTEGWEEYDWRWKTKDGAAFGRNWARPQWDGGHLPGRTILLHADQGFGDALQFIRYLPMVRERVGKIIIECQPELQRLLRDMAPDLPVMAKSQPLPSFDVHCPVLSLPRIFATDLTNIPRNVPYLHAGAADAGVWRDRLAEHSPSAKVGLVWAGNPAHKNDRSRSLSLADLAPLAKVPGVRFFSLQKGDAASEARTPPAGMELTDVAEELHDFADTAALIANLDLLIAVDTAVVHLAGAMGRPVWALLPFAADWRWLLDRSDSPWYPTMRLFRQPTAGDWGPVIQCVAEELGALQRRRCATA